MSDLFIQVELNHLVINSRVIYIRDIKTYAVKVGYTRVDADHFIKFSEGTYTTVKIDEVVNDIFMLAQGDEEFILEAPFTNIIVAKKKEETNEVVEQGPSS